MNINSKLIGHKSSVHIMYYSECKNIEDINLTKDDDENQNWFKVLDLCKCADIIIALFGSTEEI